MVRNALNKIAIPALLAALLISSGCRKKAYENPITKDTQQPDKVLFDTAIDDIEHGRYERARLTLQTLMNTYDTSEYLAKAKLAVADSWYREGGARGFAQAEAEYKDFILFYPQMEESAEAQEKICKMQYQQMDKADRDPTHAIRAQDECRQLLTQFPNSKFAPEAAQLMRNVQEVLGDAEFKVGNFYHTKGSYPASANRLQALTDQFPLYSHADDALWIEADSYQKMGDNFENQQAAAYSKIVQFYPLSSHVDEAKSRLKTLGKPIPDADPVAYAHMKYEQDNKAKRGLIGKAWGPFSGHPDLTNAAKSGTPVMEGLHPTIPASVPQVATGTQGTSANPGAPGGAGSDVTATTVTDTTLIDKAPNVLPGAAGTPANGAAPAQGAPASGTPNANTPQTGTNPATVNIGGVQTPVAQSTQPNPNAPLPQNHTGKIRKLTVQQQLKVTQKQQEQAKKLARKQADQQKKVQEEQAKADKKAADKKKKTNEQQQPQQQPAATPQPAPAAGKQ